MTPIPARIRQGRGEQAYAFWMRECGGGPGRDRPEDTLLDVRSREAFFRQAFAT